MKVKIINLLILATTVITLSSCYSVTTCVGSIKNNDPSVKVNTVKNHLFLYGLVGVKNTSIEDSKYIGNHKNYKVKKYTSFIDGLIGFITYGLYTPTTTIYYLPIENISK